MHLWENSVSVGNINILPPNYGGRSLGLQNLFISCYTTASLRRPGISKLVLMGIMSGWHDGIFCDYLLTYIVVYIRLIIMLCCYTEET